MNSLKLGPYRLRDGDRGRSTVHQYHRIHGWEENSDQTETDQTWRNGIK